MSQRTPSRWEQIVAANPDHSAWYVERFRAMAARGDDLHGESRLVDAMVARGSRILDAGSGPGRVGGELARRGHTVVGVDVDPVLIEAARADHPDATWVVDDICEMDLPAHGIDEGFDVVFSAGNGGGAHAGIDAAAPMFDPRLRSNWLSVANYKADLKPSASTSFCGQTATW